MIMFIYIKHFALIGNCLNKSVHKYERTYSIVQSFIFLSIKPNLSAWDGYKSRLFAMI